jgi:hypothetical protein
VGSNGNVYVTGQSMGVGTGLDYATVAYDAQGNQLWVARYDGNVVPDTGNGYAQAIAVDGTSVTIYVTGFTQLGTRNKFATFAYSPFSASP